MPKIIFISEGKKIEVNAKSGDTILECANQAEVKLFGGCSGAGVCGTCHVYIDIDLKNKIKEADLEEQDLLDILPNGKINSRLACQVVITDEMDGITVTIP